MRKRLETGALVSLSRSRFNLERDGFFQQASFGRNATESMFTVSKRDEEVTSYRRREGRDREEREELAAGKSRLKTRIWGKGNSFRCRR
ncbi:hypothetical protein MRB53_022980 [Persea americana]|uniref:Uncharacterized protein n=1 Tax=Persea americana TaxID=3435 RepID=A0ACC2L965_PERAE|nr:hypothetical protein MRB53_022980 [Persea americana]